MTRKPLAPKPAPSRGRGLLGLAEDAHALLDAWRTQAPPGIGGDTRAVVRTLAAEVARAVTRAERDSAAAHADGAPREADVARRLGASPSTLARWRARRRRELDADPTAAPRRRQLPT